ncbi:unnamed protein product [Paramecium primaurelia]|uniref:Transmembrane protein n=1 Tax=Paramecium primaurelia TaxID=5886 RepID=A0A8S1JPI9_PARPR|nr:unnamed protein product [Paramecium primaurelia]
MEEYINTLKKTANQERSSKRHIQQVAQLEIKRMFKFDPDTQLQKQMKQFDILLQNRQWNGNLRFCNFQGNFKIEYWIYIEKQLRFCDQLKKMKFTKSKLGLDHLQLLLKLLIWLQPQGIEIEFNHNELDDHSLNDFTLELIKSKLNLKYLLISNNPGIFRGKYLQNLSNFLEKQFTLNLSINHQYKSIILYNKRLFDEKSYSYIQKKLKRMKYHSFNLSNCFTEQNYQGFEYLIQTCYSESALETISELNISNNYLGPNTLIESLFVNLAKAKGLLKLGLNNLNQLTQSTCKALIGNRYSYLRLLELDLSNNSSIDESALQILLDEIISKSCKYFAFENTFQNSESLLAKLYHFAQSFRNRIKQGERLNLESIDLSTIENIQQYDLLEDLLKFVVFNSFSNIKSLVINPLTDGICQSYINAIQNFKKQYRTTKQLNLQQITIKKQNQQLGEDILKQLMNELFFPQENEAISIQTVYFSSRSFELDSNCFIFQQYLNSLDTYRTFSLKNLLIKNTFVTDKLTEKILQVFLAQRTFDLETLQFKEDNFNDTIYFDQILLQSKFLEKQPDIKYFALRKLDLQIVGLQMNISLFLKCFITNNQVKLNYISLANLSLTYDQLSHEHYVSPVKDDNLDLQTIKFKDNTDMNKKAFKIFSDYCIFNQFLDLQYLQISDFEYDLDLSFQFDSLKKLSLYHKFKKFDLPLKIILASPKLEELNFKKVDINEDLAKSLSKYFLLRQQKDEKGKQLFYFISKLSFFECNFSSEILQFFFLDPYCDLEQLQIIQCKGFEKTLDKLVTGLKDSQQLIKSQLSILIMKKLKLQKNIKSFLKFLEYVCFNSELIEEKDLRCQLEQLVLQNCSLNDEFFQGLIDLISNCIEQEQISKKFLQTIDFSDNNQIKSTLWRKFYQLLMSKELKRQKKTKILVQHTDFQQQEQKLHNFIEQNHLNLQDKIQIAPDKFIQSPPSRIQDMAIKFFTEFENEKEKINYYYRMLAGLIYYPKSRISNLKISDVDLDLFINTSEKLLIYSDLSKQDKQKKQTFTNIKKITISSIKFNDSLNTQSFYQLFINNLVSLKIADAQSGFMEGLLNFLDKFEGKLKITKLHLIRVNEYLNQNQSNQFLNYIIFGQKLPIKQLKISESIQFKDDEKFVKQNLSNIIPQIQKLIFKIENKDSFQFLQSFSKYLLESQNLQHFEIECTQSGSLLFENIDLMNSIPKLNVLKLKTVVDLTPKLLEFISQTATTLQEVKFQSVRIQNIKETVTWFNNAETIVLNCKLITKIDEIVEEEQDIIIQYFLSNKIFQWQQLKYKSSKGLQKFNNKLLSDNFKNLIKLEINAQFEISSNKKISNDFLFYLSKYIIYNEESKLKELILIQCNITVTQIFKLIKQAEEFSENVQKPLSLRRFTLSKSQNIDEEAFQELCRYLIFFQYIKLDRLELVQLNLSNKMIQKLIENSLEWLQFQTQKVFDFKCLNFSYNDTFGSVETWESLCKTFLFSEYTPMLTHLFLNGMDIKNHIAKLIANCAFQFFKKQGQNYQHPLKEINFSQNRSLNQIGWYFLSKYFFFHNCVDLKDIDVTDCELNEENKINKFMAPIYERVKLFGNLRIIKFRSDNISLKNSMYNVNTIPGKDKFKIISDLPFKRTKYVGWGKVEGKIQSFGILQKNIEKTLKLQRRINLCDCWQNLNEVKFSAYHLNFINHFLQILPQLTLEKEYSFSYYCLDQLFNLFQYPDNGSGNPYPLSGLFNPKCQEFFSTSQISKITLVETFFPTLEKPKQQDIWKFYIDVISKKNNLDLVEIEYTLDDDLIEYLLENDYTERDIVKLIRVVPPSHIIIQNSLTLQAIKGIYSILYESNYFQYSHISYDHRRVLNNGIGYSIRALVYGINFQYKVLIFFKKILYFLLSIFVSDANKYSYSLEIKQLNQRLQSSLLYFDFLVVLTLIYLFMCIGSPILLTIKDLDSQEDLCKKGVNQIATYSYYGFAVVTLIFESLLYKQIVALIPSHVSKLIDIDNYNQDNQDVQRQSIFGFIQQNRVTPLDEQHHLKENSENSKDYITRFNSNIKEFMNSSYAQNIQFLITLTLSQLSKYDLYNDVVFIINCFNCKQDTLYYAALIITIFNLAIYLIYFIEILIRRIQRIKLQTKYLSTQTINDFFDLCTVGRNAALAQILDTVAPYNVSVFPNKWFIRKLIPNVAGKSLNKSIKNYLIKFIFEDVPQLTLQLTFLYKMTISKQITLGWSIYITLGTSIVTIIISFFKFMQLRPSTISQTDFDKLERTNTQIYDYKINHLQNEMKMLIKYEAFSAQERNIEQSLIIKKNDSDSMV